MTRSIALAALVVLVVLAAVNLMFHHLSSDAETLIGFAVGGAGGVFGYWFYENHTDGGKW